MFCHRCEDIHILGVTSILPTRRSEWCLNGSAPVHFYVERDATLADPPQYPRRTRTPAVNRLRDLPGHFNIEIPIDFPLLRPGNNHIVLAIEGGEEEVAELHAEFSWDPQSVPLPVELSDLSNTASIQDIGQIVDGFWKIDNVRNAITTRPPIGHDALLVLGAPYQSQEATYDVMFSAPFNGTFVGLSDFFVRHDHQSSDLGIKPGYSTAGLATITSGGLAECWAAMGDNTWEKEWAWVRKSTPVFFSLKPDLIYSVRHQIIFDKSIMLSRFRIWPAGAREPKRWLNSVNTVALSPELPKPTSASFALFQYGGHPTQWSNVKVRQIEAKIGPDDVNCTFAEAWKAFRYRARQLPNRVAGRVRKLANVFMVSP